VTALEFGSAIRVVEVNDDVSGIEQDDHVLREVSKRIDLQISIAQEHGAGFGNAERGADNGEVDIRKLLRLPALTRSRLPAISGTAEQTTLAVAAFARTGARVSPEAGGSRKIPPMRSRPALNAARSEAGGFASNIGASGSGRSKRGRLSRIDLRISSRLLMPSFRGLPGTSYETSVWAEPELRAVCPRR
jgi:hypothetical protein